jgi:mannose-1-phosphate guanylyltransferase
MHAQYSKLAKISIDYAVLEKADNVALIEADFEWDDVGSWLALERHFAKDADGNVVAGMHEGLETRGCIVAGEQGHLVATFGVSDLIVIHTPDATLVCHKTKAGQMKQLIQKLCNRTKVRFL